MHSSRLLGDESDALLWGLGGFSSGLTVLGGKGRLHLCWIKKQRAFPGPATLLFIDVQKSSLCLDNRSPCYHFESIQSTVTHTSLVPHNTQPSEATIPSHGIDFRDCGIQHRRGQCRNSAETANLNYCSISCHSQSWTFQILASVNPKP